MKTCAYIDAANLFYGGKKSLGWSIDFQKLLKYLRERFKVSEVYYFAGVEIHNFPFDYIISDKVYLKDLEKYFIDNINNQKNSTLEMIKLLNRNLKQIHFYQKLEKFGFKLILKPVKIYRDEKGNQTRKANCDVEMAFYMMRDKNNYERFVILSGDGDFLPILKYLREVARKEVLVLSRGPRTAKEIKQFAGEKFMDLTNNNLQEKLEMKDL